MPDPKPGGGVPLTAPEGRLIEAALDAAAETAALRRRPPDATTVDPTRGKGENVGRLPFARLYGHATGAADPAVGRALADDAALLADYRRLLGNLATVHFPKVAAASSGALEHRQIAGARLTLRGSRADADQVYLIVQLDDTTRAPTALIATLDAAGATRLDLPPFQGGRAQLLLDKSSAVVQAFQNINAEVHLI